MIDKSKLKDIVQYAAAKYRFRPVLIEKDFYLTLILKNIEKVFKNSCVFKGGTLLNKVYFNYHRLSEDLDFSYIDFKSCGTRSGRSAAMRPIKKAMKDFVEELGMAVKSDEEEGRGFNNSTQYVFNIVYNSILTNSGGNIKIEISLRAPVYEKPVLKDVSHYFLEPFTGRDMIPGNKVLSLALEEAVAEKLRAAITRKEPAIRDFYDLNCIINSGFDFADKRFIEIFRKKIEDESYKGDYKIDFGLTNAQKENLKVQIDTDLLPVLRLEESFDLEPVMKKFNRLFKNNVFK